MKIKTHLCLGAGATILISVSSLFAMLPLTATSATSKGADWMKNVDGSTPLTALSLPGSHDAGAFYSIGDVAGKCQDLSIKEQLEAGARFFDMRLQQRSNVLNVVHGIVDQKLSWSEVLSSFSSFLEKHESEALIVSVKKEADDTNSSTTFEEALKTSLSPYASIWDTSGSLPNRLDALRGKIFLISRYDDSMIGLPAYDGWLDPESDESGNSFDITSSNLHVQDHYKVGDISVKQKEFSKCVEYSQKNKDVITLNFASCYFTSGFPPTYAGTTAKIMNPWLIENYKNQRNLGIFICDFVTSSLCEAIYARNYQ